MKIVKYVLCEWIYFSEDEKEEAIKYLDSWEKFTLRKLNKDCIYLKVVHREDVQREPYLISPLSNQGTFGRKLELHLQMKFDLYPTMFEEV